MLTVRVLDGISNRPTGLGDFNDDSDGREAAAAKARDFLENGNPPAGTQAFVQEPDGEIIYTARISDKGNIAGSWSEKTAARVAAKLQDSDDKPDDSKK